MAKWDLIDAGGQRFKSVEGSRIEASAKDSPVAMFWVYDSNGDLVHAFTGPPVVGIVRNDDA